MLSYTIHSNLISPWPLAENSHNEWTRPERPHAREMNEKRNKENSETFENENWNV